MRLVPVEGVTETVLELERQDPDAARELVRLSLYESLSDQVEEARPYLEPWVLTNMAETLAKSRSHLLREHVGKSIAGEQAPDATRTAAYLQALDDYVSKGLVGWAREQFNRKHPRDESGRFIRADTGVSHESGGSVTSRQAQASNRTLHQAHRWKQSGLIDDKTPMTLITQRHHMRSGRPAGEPEHRRTTHAELQGHLDALGDDRAAIGLESPLEHIAHPAPRAGAVDLMGLMTGDPEFSSRLVRAVPEGRQDEAAQRWNAPSGSGSDPLDRRGYRRMEMTGQALQSIAMPGSNAHIAGSAAQFIGQVGPEAERVLGPGVRRTAYRYRGTERRPDPTVVRRASPLPPRSPRPWPPLRWWTSTPRRSGRSTRLCSAWPRSARPSGARTSAGCGWPGTPRSPTYSASEVRGAASPTCRASSPPSCSIASGEMPPSEGVLIDDEGDVVSQAVGYNGDHYLPFDLKVLPRLHGGQYVRTRASGGRVPRTSTPA